MHKFIFASGLLVASLATLACGKNDCVDGYERIKAKYDDCLIDSSGLTVYTDSSECSEAEGKSLQSLADTYEKSTCTDLRALAGQRK